MLSKIFFKSAPNVSNCKIIDGKAISWKILNDYKAKFEKLKAEYSITPGLAIIQTGDRQDSNIYIKNKLKVATFLGIDAKLYKYDKDFSKSEILDKINELNNDKSINGIITQLPIVSFHKFNYSEFTDKVLPEKDVDCLNYQNLKKIFDDVTVDCFIPCAAKSCVEILKLLNIDLMDKNITIVGASKLVGLPLKHLLKFENTSVNLCDDHTRNLEDVCKQADILIVAIGSSNFIRGSYIKKGAVVIDVGINYDKQKKKVTGDIDFEEAIKKASYITPVPGGIGPITVSMLMANTYDSTLRYLKNFDKTQK